MDEEPDDPSFTPRDDTGQKEKAGFKPSSMVDMKPCEDLHRYVVDKFHATTKSKPVLFEEIDLSTYKSTAKVASFLTSEDRLLLWIKLFSIRYFDHLNNGSVENEALENEDRSTKHPSLENEAPKSRKRSTQISKTKHPRSKTKHPRSKTKHPTTRKRSTQNSKTKTLKTRKFGCFVFEIWVLRFRDLGASCFGLRFRVLRFRYYQQQGISCFMARTGVIQLPNQERQNYPTCLCRRKQL